MKSPYPWDIIAKMRRQRAKAAGSVIDPIHESVDGNGGKARDGELQKQRADPDESAINPIHDGNVGKARDGKSNISDKILPMGMVVTSFQQSVNVDREDVKTNHSADVHRNKERKGAYDSARKGWGEEQEQDGTNEGKWSGNCRNRATPAQKWNQKLDLSITVERRPANSGYHSSVQGNTTHLLDAKPEWPSRPRRYSASRTTPSLRAENLLVEATIDAAKEEVDATRDWATRPRRYSAPPCTQPLPAPEILAQGATEDAKEEFDAIADLRTNPRRNAAPPSLPALIGPYLLHQAVLNAAEKEECWHYIDRNEMVQGPFSLEHFRKCSSAGKFHEDMGIWLERPWEAIALKDALSSAPSIKKWRTLFVGSLFVWLQQTLAEALTGSSTSPLNDPAAMSADTFRETGEASSSTDREGFEDAGISTSWEGRDVDQ